MNLLSRHSEIIAVLKELYNLLESLAALSPEIAVLLPPADTSVHSPNVFNFDAARAAGFNEEAVAVLSALPYLDVGEHEMHMELQPSTYPVSYLGIEMDEGYFSSKREMLDDELLMPESAVQLTWEEGGDGVVYIYDTGTSMFLPKGVDCNDGRLGTLTTIAIGLVTPWKHWGDPSDSSDYFHVPAVTPREAFQPLINKYRTLEYLGTPPFMELNNDLFPEYGRTPPEDFSDEGARAQYRADYDVWEAKRKLKDLYVECGWDVGAVEQAQFRREEFVERRERYLKEVVEPLEEEASRVGSERSLESLRARGLECAFEANGTGG